MATGTIGYTLAPGCTVDGMGNRPGVMEIDEIPEKRQERNARHLAVGKIEGGLGPRTFSTQVKLGILDDSGGARLQGYAGNGKRWESTPTARSDHRLDHATEAGPVNGFWRDARVGLLPTRAKIPRRKLSGNSTRLIPAG